MLLNTDQNPTQLVTPPPPLIHSRRDCVLWVSRHFWEMAMKEHYWKKLENEEKKMKWVEGTTNVFGDWFRQKVLVLCKQKKIDCCSLSVYLSTNNNKSLWTVLWESENAGLNKSWRIWFRSLLQDYFLKNQKIRLHEDSVWFILEFQQYLPINFKWCHFESIFWEMRNYDQSQTNNNRFVK